MTAQVIKGVMVAPGEVKCGVRGGLSVVAQIPLTEAAMGLKGVARYLSPDWDVPTCPVIGKGANDHCKHGMGNLDYCHLCDTIDLSDMEI